MDRMDLLIRGLSIDWDSISADSYLRDIPSIAKLERLEFNGPVTIFQGENGSGKSTLLEAIAVAYGFNPEGGTRNYSFSTYDSHSELHNAVTLVRGINRARWGYFLRAESFYNVATAEEEYSRGPGGRPQQFHELSNGESILEAVLSNLGPDSIYFLDEADSAFSPQRQLTLLAAIAEQARQGSQFFIATHSPILMGIPDAEILCFDGEIHPVRYEETESYRVTEMFINDRERLLDRLLSEDE